jgi:hypothetical protein
MWFAQPNLLSMLHKEIPTMAQTLKQNITILVTDSQPPGLLMHNQEQLYTSCLEST